MKWFRCIFLLMLFSCASVGNPGGGDYDIVPPAMQKSTPAPNAVNYRKNRIELTFDEYVSIEQPSEKVIVTPPQKKQPSVRAIGKKIIVEIKDSLQENTTYTLDFTNGIVDNNEKNAIEGFAFAFSTGDVVDTMMVSGILLNASNLEPQPNIMVGLHANLEDSAFTTIPFLRTSMTNDRGQFKIRNVAPGTYRLFALADLDKNYLYNPPAEEIAFYDSLVVPSFEPAIRLDTLWADVDSLTIDTVREIHYNRFLPDDIVMRLFQKKFDNQYLSKTERPQENRLLLHFNSETGLPPKISLLETDSTERTDDEWYLTELSADRKDVTFWLRDSTVYQRDSIWIKAEYPAVDTLYNLATKTDTLRFVWRHKAVEKQKQKAEKAKKQKKNAKTEEKPVINFLTLSISAKQTMDVYDTVKIVFDEPVINFDTKMINIRQKVDTLWEDREFPIVGDSLNPRTFFVDNFWDYEEEFQIRIDSGAVFSIYDRWNDSIVQTFKFKKAEEYANFYVTVVGAAAGFGELLDRGDKVVRKADLIDGELAFENILPGTYYIRYTEDTNSNEISLAKCFIASSSK